MTKIISSVAETRIKSSWGALTHLLDFQTRCPGSWLWLSQPSPQFFLSFQGLGAALSVCSDDKAAYSLVIWHPQLPCWMKMLLFDKSPPHKREYRSSCRTKTHRSQASMRHGVREAQDRPGPEQTTSLLRLLVEKPIPLVSQSQQAGFWVCYHFPLSFSTRARWFSALPRKKTIIFPHVQPRAGQGEKGTASSIAAPLTHGPCRFSGAPRSSQTAFASFGSALTAKKATPGS